MHCSGSTPAAVKYLSLTCPEFSPLLVTDRKLHLVEFFGIEKLPTHSCDTYSVMPWTVPKTKSVVLKSNDHKSPRLCTLQNYKHS